MIQDKKPEFLKDFPPVTTQAWEEKILEDLKGADYEKRLVWKTPDGITAKPYYRAEHLDNLAFMGALPGENPYVRGKRVKDNDWKIHQDVEEEDIDRANARAIKAIEKGAQSVGLNARAVQGIEDLAALLQGIDLNKVSVSINHAISYPPLFKLLTELAGDTSLKGSLNFDPLGYYVLYGKLYQNLDANLDEAQSLLQLVGTKHLVFRLITINGQHYHNAGAGIVQELAFSLSQANEYLALLIDRGLDVDMVAPSLRFRLAIGSNYFLEIAKLRAIKMLWATIVAQYHPTKKESSEMFIHAESSAWNKSVYDPYTNLLRTTTEAMSAAIGGVDSMSLATFDSTYKKPDEISLRLARNQQIVLKHESYFNKVVDPSAGSYYIENLTDSIAQAVWKLFVSIEEKGGFMQAAESGFFKDSIAVTSQKRDMDIAMRRQVFVGTNQYPNARERVLDKLQPTARLSDLGGLRPYRGTQAFEALRLAVENHEQKGFNTPSVFLMTYGNLAMRKARATFSTNFFGVAGYHIAEGDGYKQAAAGIDDALACKAQIIVFCSSDEEYAELPAIAKTIKETSPDTILAVAGNPTELLDQLKEAGIDNFIHMRTNALETLTWYHDKLGIG